MERLYFCCFISFPSIFVPHLSNPIERGPLHANEGIVAVFIFFMSKRSVKTIIPCIASCFGEVLNINFHVLSILLGITLQC